MTAQNQYCPICLSNKSGDFTRISRGLIKKCDSCSSRWVIQDGHGQANEFNFYNNTEKNFRPYFEGLRKKQYLDAFNKLDIESGIKHLDIGCSYGWLVEMGLSFGFDSFGIESGTIEFPKNLEKRLQQVSFENYVQSHQHPSWNLITLWHVLEHFQEPRKTIEDVVKLLNPGGGIVISVPSTEGGMFKLASICKRFGYGTLLEKLFFAQNPNMHYVYFSPGGLCRLLEGYGFKIQKVLYQDAFDWQSISMRFDSVFKQTVLKLGGPIAGHLINTSRENVIVYAVLERD